MLHTYHTGTRYTNRYIFFQGHSFGGATTVLSLALDSRFKMGVALDAWLFPLRDFNVKDIKQPLMFISTGRTSIFSTLTEIISWQYSVVTITIINNPV